MDAEFPLPLAMFLSLTISAAPLLVLAWREQKRWTALLCTAVGHQVGYFGTVTLASLAGLGSSSDLGWLWTIGGFAGGIVGFGIGRALLSKGSRPVSSRRASDFVPADVFISYRRDERARVRAIAREFEAMSLRVWFDAELRSGTAFDTEIDLQVRAAKCVLVCWSPSAVQSDWVRGEATIGRQRGVLAAALLEPCDLPSPFNLTHASDFTDGIDLESSEWLRLLDRVGELVGRKLR